MRYLLPLLVVSFASGLPSSAMADTNSDYAFRSSYSNPWISCKRVTAARPNDLYKEDELKSNRGYYGSIYRRGDNSAWHYFKDEKSCRTAESTFGE